MELSLTWDLFIVVFFWIIIAYSFIIGKNQTIRVIIGAYLAIFTADALGNLFEQFLLPNIPSLNGVDPIQVLIMFKVIMFVLVIVVLAVKGGFYVDFADEGGMIKKIVVNTIFGLLNAGLIISAMLVYVSGGSFIAADAINPISFSLYKESEIVRLMIDNYNVWFSLPAIAFVITSFTERRYEE